MLYNDSCSTPYHTKVYINLRLRSQPTKKPSSSKKSYQFVKKSHPVLDLIIDKSTMAWCPSARCNGRIQTINVDANVDSSTLRYAPKASCFDSTDAMEMQQRNLK